MLEDRFFWPLIVSFLYLFLILLIVLSYWDPHFSSLEPNSWGDFLAGTLGPLAIGWVALGYFVQSNELKQSVEAVKEQTEQIADQNEQHRSMRNFEEEKYDATNRISYAGMVNDIVALDTKLVFLLRRRILEVHQAHHEKKIDGKQKKQRITYYEGILDTAIKMQEGSKAFENQINVERLPLDLLIDVMAMHRRSTALYEQLEYDVYQLDLKKQID